MANRWLTVPQRWWLKVAKMPGGCWLWTGAKSTNGYGRIRIGGVQVGAHRVGYEILVGPIAEGMQLDHRCRVRLCVNPGHLEVVTNRENVLRGSSPTATTYWLPTCRRGHSKDEFGRLDAKGHWQCRACNLARYHKIVSKRRLDAALAGEGQS
jgi:hypothetical protein